MELTEGIEVMMTKNILKIIKEKWGTWSQKRKAALVASTSSVLMLGIVAVSLHAYALDRGDASPCRIDPPASRDVQQASEGSAAQNELIGPVLAGEVAPSEEAPAQPEQPAQPAQEAEANKQSAVQVKAEQPKQSEHKAPAKEVVEHKAPAKHVVEHKAPAPAQEAPKVPSQEVQVSSDKKPEAQPAPKKKGHWKIVIDKPAWDEPVYEEVPNYERVGYAVFWADGYRSSNMDDTLRHMYELMDAGKSSAYRTETVKEPRPGTHKEYVGMSHHEPIMHKEWVVD